MKQVTMDDILNSKLGESSGDIRVVFQKKTAVKQYEPEMIEVESTLRVDKTMSGEDRMIASAILLAQVEYTAFVELLAKKQVSSEEFMARKKELEAGMQAIYNKYVAIAGKEPAEYFE